MMESLKKCMMENYIMLLLKYMYGLLQTIFHCFKVFTNIISFKSVFKYINIIISQTDLTVKMIEGFQNGLSNIIKFSTPDTIRKDIIHNKDFFKISS